MSTRALGLFACLSVAACFEGGGGGPAVGPEPEIVAVQHPATLTADEERGGCCVFDLRVTYRPLPEGHTIPKGYVRFPGVGRVEGVDQSVLFRAPTVDESTGLVSTTGAVTVPGEVVRRGAQVTFDVRFVTGVGVETSPISRTIAIQ